MKSALLPLLLALVFTLPVAAQTTESKYVPLADIPGLTSSEIVNSPNLSNFWNALYRLCIGAAVVLAVVQVIRGGIAYMTTDSVIKIGDAKSLIWQSIVGLALVLSPVLVLSIVNPDIVSLELGNGLTNTAADSQFEGAENPEDPMQYNNPLGGNTTITREQDMGWKEWAGPGGQKRDLDGSITQTTRTVDGRNEVRFGEGQPDALNAHLEVWVKACTDNGGVSDVRYRASCLTSMSGSCVISSPAIASCTYAPKPAGS